MMSMIPCPQKDTRTYILSGLGVATLALGKFSFDPANIQLIDQIRPGVLYRVTEFVLTANVSETALVGAFEPTAAQTIPTAVLRYGETSVSPKPFPLFGLGQVRQTLNYFSPTTSNQKLSIGFAGSFNASMLTVPSLIVGYSFTMQEFADKTWVDAYNDGKF